MTVLSIRLGTVQYRACVRNLDLRVQSVLLKRVMGHKISGCKRWFHKDLWVCSTAAPCLTHTLSQAFGTSWSLKNDTKYNRIPKINRTEQSSKSISIESILCIYIFGRPTARWRVSRGALPECLVGTWFARPRTAAANAAGSTWCSGGRLVW
jgi:hypothetical protein